MEKEVKSLNQRLLAAMDEYPEQACFQIKRAGRYQNVSYRRFQARVFRTIKFFQARGVTNGERVAIIADNSLEWMVAYIACLLAGGVIVPLRATLPSDTLQFILQDTEARLAILQEPHHVQAILADMTPDAPNHLANLAAILLINNSEETPIGATPGSPKYVRPGLRRMFRSDPGQNGGVLPTTLDSPSAQNLGLLVPINTVLAEASPSADELKLIRTHAENIPAHALASIHYIASETGRPRGSVFNHAQSAATLQHIAEWFKIEQDDLAFTITSWSEATSLAASLHYFLSGIPNALVDDYETVAENIQQSSPTVILSVPYSWEKFYEGYTTWLSEQPEANQKVIQWALAKGKEYHAAGSAASPELRQEYIRADMTFFSQFKGKIGGRLRRLYSTGSSLPQEVASFFEAIGIPVLNLYSLVEAGGFPAVTRPETYRFGSCGQVAPGFEIRIADDGEILVRGKTIMREYWRRPEETKQAIDEKGWLHSGDLGYLDKDGYLYVTDRKRHVMVLTTGRKIFPTVIENTLTANRFIAQAAVIAEGKPYVSAMIVPDLKALADHFHHDEEPVTTTGHPRVKALLEEVIGQVNQTLDRWEQIREYSLLEQPLSHDAGELTPSMKISRHVVAARYAPQIEAMYPVKLRLEAENVSQVQVEPERLRALLEKEKILDAWMEDAGIQFLFDLAQDRQIDAPSIVHICDAAATIAQMENEAKPLSTALIVGDPALIARVLPESQIQLHRPDHIRRMRNTLVSLASLVDGLVLGYMIDKHGYVRGIHKLNIEPDESVNFLLGPQFRRHAAISGQCDAIVFFVPAGGRQVRVFADGQLVGRYSDGDWSPENIFRVDEIIAHLAEQKNYNPALIRRILRCAFRMSEDNLGAIFILGNADVILKHSDASEISHFASILSAPMDNISDQELINFAKQDGATVIDIQGKFRGCMVLLRPEANTQAEIGPGKGARHSSAAKMSAEANCLAITVSHDGPITIYDSGQRVLSL
jgi:long-chain acyl-CoA synthetase